MSRKTWTERIGIVMVAIAAAMLPAAGGFKAHDDAQEPPGAVVETRDLVLTAKVPGRVESTVRRNVLLDLEAFNGQLDITEIVQRSGPIRKGQVILRVDTEPLDRQIDDAEFALRNARQSLEFAEQESRILSEANILRRERADAAVKNAQHAFEIFDRFTGQRMLRSAELRVRQQEYHLEDQKEELAQLEKMYEDSTLASETKEIVIERNRRQIAISEEYLQFARDDLLITREYTYPDEKERVEKALEWATVELEHALVNAKISEARKVTDLASSKRAAAEAERKLTELQEDRARVNLEATVDGVLTPIELESGDSIRAGQQIAQIVDPAKLIVSVDAAPADLRVLAVGDAVTVTLPAFPEVRLRGEVVEISAIGKPAGDSTKFPIRVELREKHPLVRVGLECRVEAERTLPDTLSVPKDAVKTEDGKTICYVVRGEETETREVTIGATGDEFTQIVSGLNEGDRVLLEKPAAAEDEE